MKANVVFNDDTLLDVRDMNNVIEISHTEMKWRNIINIDGYNVDADTGEVLASKDDKFEIGASKTIGKQKIFQTKENTSSHEKKKTRLSNPKSLSNTRKHMKNVIITAYESADKFSFITLLYDKEHNRADVNGVKKDMDALIKKIRRKYTADNKIKYFYTIETNHGGFFHIHLLLYWEKYVPKKFIYETGSLWKFGDLFYSPKLRNEHDIVYLASYLTFGTCSNTAFLRRYIVASTREEKKAIKRARLACFGQHQRIFFHSNDMPEAKKTVMTYAEFIKKYKPKEENNFYSGTFKKTVSTKLTIHQEYKYYYNSC